MRVARKVMGPDLDLIQERKKQGLHRVEEGDQRGKQSSFLIVPQKSLRKCIVTHCLQRHIKPSVNHHTTQLSHIHN